jgi:hypothetical protein
MLADPNVSIERKVAAASLVVSGVFGAAAGIQYANSARPLFTSAGNSVATVEVPTFPLPVQAPPGIVLKSMQPGLSAEKVGQIPGLIESLLAGESIPAIGGYKSGNVYYVNEGNHRIAAALSIFLRTGDEKPLMSLLQGGNWTSGSPTGKTWNITDN